MEPKMIMIRVTPGKKQRAFDLLVDGTIRKSAVTKEAVRAWLKDNYHPPIDTLLVAHGLLQSDFYRAKNVSV